MIVPKEIIFKMIVNNALSLDKDKKEYGCFNHFFEDYSENDFEELKQIASQYGFKVEKACNIVSEDKVYQKIWKCRKSLIVYWNKNNL